MLSRDTHRFLFSASLLLAGCNIPPNPETEKKIAAANQQTASLMEEIESIKKELAQQKQQKEFDELLQSFEKIAYLTPGSDGYSSIRF